MFMHRCMEDALLSLFTDQVNKGLAGVRPASFFIQSWPRSSTVRS